MFGQDSADEHEGRSHKLRTENGAAARRPADLQRPHVIDTGTACYCAGPVSASVDVTWPVGALEGPYPTSQCSMVSHRQEEPTPRHRGRWLRTGRGLLFGSRLLLRANARLSDQFRGGGLHAVGLTRIPTVEGRSSRDRLGRRGFEAISRRSAG